MKIEFLVEKIVKGQISSLSVLLVEIPSRASIWSERGTKKKKKKNVERESGCVTAEADTESETE